MLFQTGENLADHWKRFPKSFMKLLFFLSLSHAEVFPFSLSSVECVTFVRICFGPTHARVTRGVKFCTTGCNVDSLSIKTTIFHTLACDLFFARCKNCVADPTLTKNKKKKKKTQVESHQTRSTDVNRMLQKRFQHVFCHGECVFAVVARHNLLPRV